MELSHAVPFNICPKRSVFCHKRFMFHVLFSKEYHLKSCTRTPAKSCETVTLVLFWIEKCEWYFVLMLLVCQEAFALANHSFALIIFLRKQATLKALSHKI